MNNDYNSKSTQELADGLALYLKQDYINPLYHALLRGERCRRSGFYLQIHFLYCDLILSC